MALELCLFFGCSTVPGAAFLVLGCQLGGVSVDLGRLGRDDLLVAALAVREPVVDGRDGDLQPLGASLALEAPLVEATTT